MASNFITNNSRQKTLRGRINTLISISTELRFLVGFFYFSGWKEVYESLQKNEDIQIKLLVGLEVEHLLGKAIEHSGREGNLSQDDYFNRFITSLDRALNNDQMDQEVFYRQVVFFLDLLESGRLIIRKTQKPNHAKLYLFNYNAHHRESHNTYGESITGSSNLTHAGLGGQEEFNVEIRDYGFEEASQYFEELWSQSIPISENSERRKYLIHFIRHKTQAAEVEPFDAYLHILKTYLDLQNIKLLRPDVETLLEQQGFKKFSYQLDAVNQSLSIIEQYHGVIIADVVGLGKSVIAALIAKNLGKRGMVVCPPGLIGDKHISTGWWEYLNKFGMYDWEVESRGRISELSKTLDDNAIEVLIIDEAHNYRNQDTDDYEALHALCRDRTVILLTATPFNNSPADIFSLLKLFIVPGKSGITLEDNLESRFRSYNYKFQRLSDISKNYNSPNSRKRERAERLYKEIIHPQLPIDLSLVQKETHSLASEIKKVIAPVVLRRNRIDLKEDPLYSKEIGELPVVDDPVELFFELGEKELSFYDKIIQEYFVSEGRFTGAIYRPFIYEKTIAEDDLDEAGNRRYQQQQNLFDFMRRLLVKRFESSFGAFAKSIAHFISIHELVLEFIKNSGGKYILDRRYIESIYKYDEDEILEALSLYQSEDTRKSKPKNDTVYDLDKMELKEQFLLDIRNDLQLFREVQVELENLNLVQKDPKRQKVAEVVGQSLAKDPRRKIILFTEYIDTVHHLKEYFSAKFGSTVLTCDGKITRQLAKFLNEDFNAQYGGTQTNHFNILITSDKLAEGYNLNRAGTLINYDIPWNPTRVIQRVGRINRIGKQQFSNLKILNFFPSEIGANIVRSREIAGQKMFLIHNSLGEDAKIFEASETPSASGLFQRINDNPDDLEELSISTRIRKRFAELSEKYPERIERISQLPPRVKTAKEHEEVGLSVLRKKSLSLFVQYAAYDKGSEIQDLLFEEFLQVVECEITEKKKPLSSRFWNVYEKMKTFQPNYRLPRGELSLEQKATKNLKTALQKISPDKSAQMEFMKELLRDIRNYHTLSTRTLGRLGRVPLQNPSQQELKSFLEELDRIMEILGPDYLKRLEQRLKVKKSEVIIAVENVSKS